MRLYTWILTVLACCCLATGAAAQSGKYAPFTVDDDHIIHLNISSPAVMKKYEAIFKKHGRNAADPSDWDGVIQQIVGETDTDLLMDGSISMDTGETEFTADAATDQNVARFMKAVRPTLTNPEKLDAFLTHLDQILKKGKG